MDLVAPEPPDDVKSDGPVVVESNDPGWNIAGTRKELLLIGALRVMSEAVANEQSAVLDAELHPMSIQNQRLSLGS
ncbi:MAG: hypothetical protein ACR2JC_21430 [Chloroflexota bacterium]